jgi:hypothetical protein
VAGQPEQDAVLPAIREHRPAAVQLPRQPPAVHERRGGARRVGGAELPVPHAQPGALPERVGVRLRRARRHHLPRPGQLHGGRVGQVSGEQRGCRLQHRLPLGLPGVRLRRHGVRLAALGVVVLVAQDPRRPAGRVALHRQHPGQGRPAAVRRLGRLAHRKAVLQHHAARAGHRVRWHERRAHRPVPADRRGQVAHGGAAVRPRRRLRPAGGEPGPAERTARQHAGAQVGGRGPRVQGHRHHALPGHRRQRVGHHGRRAHLRHRWEQPGRALPRAQRDRLLPADRHRGGVQHLQHAQADP